MRLQSDYGYTANPQACRACHSFAFPCKCPEWAKVASPVVCEDAQAPNGDFYTLGMAKTELGARRVLQRWLKSRRLAGSMVRYTVETSCGREMVWGES